jgi:hypothetical protein
VRWDRRELAAIFVGGFLGAVARALLAHWLPSEPGEWPWATFAVNVTGAALLGYFRPPAARRQPLATATPCPGPDDRRRHAGRARRWFEIVDEVTDETGLVTSEIVPAFRATGPGVQAGGLKLARPWDAEHPG